MTETNNSSESRVTQTEQQLIGVEESKGIKRLHTIDSDVLFEKQLEKRRFIVEGLLPEGLIMLSGDPKAGKSFFALSLSVSVAKGIPFLCFPTSKCNVLYFCFEDDEKRLQQRLFEMSDENFTGLSFCNEVLRLGDGFTESVEAYLDSHPDTKLIVVDTLNYIRPDKQGSNMYRDDYDDMIKLHRLTQKYGIALVIIHHNKKNVDEDVLRSISGSMGLSGGADNCIVIQKPKKGRKVSTMNVVSRDMESFEMKIMQNENGVWVAAEDLEITKKEISITVRAVYLFYTLTHFSDEPLKVSPTELSEGINEKFSVSIPPTMIKKNLTADHEDLESLGLKFDYERTKQGRKLVFRENENYSTPKRFYYDENGRFVFEAFFSSDYEDETDGDSGDRVTGEIDSGKNSFSAVNADDPEGKTEENNTEASAENECSAPSESVSGDSSSSPVTGDSRCENSCQPVNLAPTEDKKPPDNSGGKKKKHGKKKKSRKGGKKR